MARENSLTQKVTVETYQAAPVVEVRPATMPWWVAGVGGAVVCALGGWAIIAALALVSQLAEGGIVVASAFRFSAQFWLLGHGGAFEQGTRLTLVPLGFTLVVALMLHGTAAYATKQAVLAAGPDCRRGLAVLKGWGTVTLAYAVIAVVVSFVIDPAELRAGLGAAALSAVAGFLGARKAARWDFHESWPVWARAVPRALLGGTLAALLGGVVVLAAGLLAHRTEIVTLTGQLHAGPVGSIVLALVQVAYAGNLILWSTAWSCGPGFTLGDGSVVSLAGAQVGLLPAFPVTAALPSGVGTAGALWWLVFPVLAGVCAAVMVLRARPRARFDETALVGGLSGVLAGLVVAGLAALSRGDLGTDRLTGLGPFVVPLLVIAPTLMGLAGLVTGFVAGLVRRPAGATDPRWWSRWETEAGAPGAVLDEVPTVRVAGDRTAKPEVAEVPTIALRVGAQGAPGAVVVDQPVAPSGDGGPAVVPAPSKRTLREWLGRMGRKPAGDTTITVAADMPEQAGGTSGEPAAAAQREDEQPPLDFHADSW